MLRGASGFSRVLLPTTELRRRENCSLDHSHLSFQDLHPIPSAPPNLVCLSQGLAVTWMLIHLHQVSADNKGIFIF